MCKALWMSCICLGACTWLFIADMCFSRIVHYAKFVESLKDTEEGPGCEHCTDNRLLLEHAWQVVANEFYDPAGHFSQAKWADQLLTSFKVTLAAHMR